jgi:hypothetical protein
MSWRDPGNPSFKKWSSRTADKGAQLNDVEPTPRRGFLSAFRDVEDDAQDDTPAPALPGWTAFNTREGAQ